MRLADQRRVTVDVTCWIVGLAYVPFPVLSLMENDAALSHFALRFHAQVKHPLSQGARKGVHRSYRQAKSAH